MSRLHLELTDIAIGRVMLRSHIRLLEGNLYAAVEQQQREYQAKLQENPQVIRDEKDWAEYQADIEQLTYMVDVALPHQFRGPFIVTLWAVFESSVRKLANLLKDKQHQASNLDDFGGEILTRAKNYYSHILHFNLCNQQQLARLRDLYLLRNAFAHSNGYLDLMKGSDKIKDLISRRNHGLSEEYGHIIMTKEFLEGEHSLVEEILHDMLQRYVKV
jgi:hypothetical protein